VPPLPRLLARSLARAQAAEVLGSPRHHIRAELATKGESTNPSSTTAARTHFDEEAASELVANLHIEEHAAWAEARKTFGLGTTRAGHQKAKLGLFAEGFMDRRASLIQS